MYRVITVPDDAADLTEQLGTKPKFWFQSARFNDDCLFKEGRSNSGDDWSEKVASELCSLLGLPHAGYDFAIWKGREGVVTPSFVPAGGRLVLGNEVLAQVVSEYPGRSFYSVRQHTLRLVLAVVRSNIIEPPIAWTSFNGVHSAIDVFIGYLMLDAWIANQDRHHENWGFVVSPEGIVHLAPSYDHASSLGSNETDNNRRDRLTTRDKGRSMESYVERATSPFFALPSNRKPMPTLTAFSDAAKTRPAAARSWLDRLNAVSSRDTVFVFDEVPPDRICGTAVDFAQRMLELNRQRLLALKQGLP